ncbi:MAG: fluoride efflux transporter CrcB [Actinomycetes bacterium]
MTILAIALAGAIGAPLRFMVDGFIKDRLRPVFPWGTFVVNMSGSVLLGFLTGVALYHGFPSVPKAFLATGFCGAYTTFSTFGYETIRLAEGGEGLVAGANALGSLAAGLAAAVSGLALAAVL